MTSHVPPHYFIDAIAIGLCTSITTRSTGQKNVIIRDIDKVTLLSTRLLHSEKGAKSRISRYIAVLRLVSHLVDPHDGQYRRVHVKRISVNKIQQPNQAMTLNISTF